MISLSDVIESTGGTAVQTVAREFSGASIDTRTLRRGELFFALRAARDGHEFLAAAAAAGAGGVVVERGRAVPAGVTAVAVDDPRLALGALGRSVRKRVAPRVAAVTGSAGKTTTKDLLAAALGDGTLKTEGNLNNDLGVPLTLVRLTPAHRFAVIEMGMSARGEIAYLAELARPDVGVVTIVAPAHLEKLGSIEEIARAKGELYHGLAPGGVAVLPDDDARLAEEAAGAARRVTFGETSRADVRLAAWQPAGAAGSDLTLAIGDGQISFRLPLVGRHNARNAAAAAAAAWALGRAPADIAAGMATARPAHHRSEIVELGGRSVLADLYNANPSSVTAALDALGTLRGGRRAVAILGDMLELGPDAVALHQAVGAHAARASLDGLVGVGKLGREIVRGALEAGMALEQVFMTTEKIAAAVRVVEWTEPGDWILIKGSRGMHMEDVLDALKDELG